MKEYNLKNYLKKAKEFSYLSRIDIVNTVYKVKGGHLGGLFKCYRYTFFYLQFL